MHVRLRACQFIHHAPLRQLETLSLRATLELFPARLIAAPAGRALLELLRFDGFGFETASHTSNACILRSWWLRRMAEGGFADGGFADGPAHPFPPSAIRHPPSAIRHPPSAIRHLPSAICHLPSAQPPPAISAAAIRRSPPERNVSSPCYYTGMKNSWTGEAVWRSEPAEE